MTKRILIADDDLDIVASLSKRCEALGVEVTVAGNAMMALEKAQEIHPDAVILDVNMPYGNGLSVCEMMAGHERLCKVPVIMLTGQTDEETFKRCLQLSAYYVPKGTGVWLRVEPLLRDILGVPKRASAAEEGLSKQADELDVAKP